MMDTYGRTIDTEPADMAEATTSPGADRDPFIEDIIAALRTVHDPEIPVNIYDLGLIYRIDVKDQGVIEIDMTLTAPGCPVAGEMLGWVERPWAALKAWPKQKLVSSLIHLGINPGCRRQPSWNSVWHSLFDP
jgi:metal-sulfur cluster biosynthetic enzyme